VDLLRDLGRPGFDLRMAVERRSGRDRRCGDDVRHSIDHHDVFLPDVVMPWQIAEPVAG
jgi:hypothetical protein